MVTVPLTRGKVALIDAADADHVLGFRWHAEKGPCGVWYARTTGLGRAVLLHTFLTGFKLTDHINGDGLDNRRCNLRPATPTENQRNRRRHKGRSIYKGLGWCTRDQRWRVRIRVNRRQMYVGRFDDEITAALAYDAAARIHFGEFATFNFPRPGEQSAVPATH